MIDLQYSISMISSLLVNCMLAYGYFFTREMQSGVCAPQVGICRDQSQPGEQMGFWCHVQDHGCGFPSTPRQLQPQKVHPAWGATHESCIPRVLLLESVSPLPSRSQCVYNPLKLSLKNRVCCCCNGITGPGHLLPTPFLTLPELCWQYRVGRVLKASRARTDYAASQVCMSVSERLGAGTVCGFFTCGRKYSDYTDDGGHERNAEIKSYWAFLY